MTLTHRAKTTIGIVLIAAATVWVFIETGLANPAPWALLLAFASAGLLIRRGENNPGFLIWLDEYSVGIEAFDNDHKRLLSLINNLRAAVECQTGETFERSALQAVLDYTRTHFEREEQLMIEHHYPDFVTHKAEHDRMVDYIDRFLSRYEDEGNRVLAEVADYLTGWLLKHINYSDHKYSRFFIAKGVR